MESASPYALRQERALGLLSPIFICSMTTCLQITDKLLGHRPATAETMNNSCRQRNLCPTSQPADRRRVAFPLDRCTTGPVSRQDPTAWGNKVRVPEPIRRSLLVSFCLECS